MKTPPFLRRNLCVLSIGTALLLVKIASADTANGVGWKGTTSSTWTNSLNWTGNPPTTTSSNERNLFFGQAYKAAGGSGSTTSNNNLTDWHGYKITFQDSNATGTGTDGSAANDTAFTIIGNSFQLFDFGNIFPKIQNDSFLTQTFNLSSGGIIKLSDTSGVTNKTEINPVNGDLVFSSTTAVDLGGVTQLQIFGNKTVTFNAPITSSGNSGNNSVLISTNGDGRTPTMAVVGTGSSYNGGTFVNAGTLQLGAIGGANGAISGTISLGDTNSANGNTPTAQLLIAGAGGQTISNAIQTRSGSSGLKAIIGNFTGTDILAGTVTLNVSATTATAANSVLQYGTVAGGQSLTIGNGTFTNLGTISLAGSADNPSLNATVNSGTLLLAKTSSSSVHAIGGPLVVNSGGTVQLGGTLGDQIFDTAATTINSGGAFDSNDRNETLGVLSLAGTGTGGTGALVNSGSGTSALTPSSTSLTANTTIGVTSAAAGLTLNNVVGGGFSLTKVGAGTLTLAGANTYSGGTIINGGTIAISQGANLGTAPGSPAVNITFDSGTLKFLADNNPAASRTIQLNAGGGTIDTNGFVVGVGSLIQGSGALTKSGNGTLTLSGANSYTGGTNLNAGALALGASDVVSGGVITTGPVGTGTLTMAGGTTLRSDSTTSRIIHNNVSVSGAITLGDATNTGIIGFVASSLTTPSTFALTTDTTLNVLSNVNLSQAVTGAFTLTKSGSASLALNTANSYSGGTVISAGTLALNNSGALGSTTASVTVNGGSLAIQGTSPTIGVLAGSGGTVKNDSGPSGSLTVGNGNGSGSYAGTIDNGGGSTLSLVKTGSGSETLTGSNTYTGGTTINNGTLALGNATDTLADGGAINVNGGTLSIGTNSDTVGAVTLTSGSITGSTGTLTGSSYGVQSGSITAKLGGSGAMTKTTGGTVILTGDSSSSYSGATSITAGTLQVDGSIGGSAVSLNGATAKLTGVGFVGALTITNGTLAPGDSPGTIHTGNLSLTSNATYSLELNGATAGLYDSTSVTGTVSLGGATLALTFGNGYSATAGDTLTIINNDGNSDAVSGIFAGLIEGATVSGFTISYHGGDGNDVVLSAPTAVPEPSTWLVGTLALASLVVTSHRRFARRTLVAPACHVRSI